MTESGALPLELDAHAAKTFSTLIKTGIAVCAIYSPVNYFNGDTGGAIAVGLVLVVIMAIAAYVGRGGNLDRALHGLAGVTCCVVAFQAARQGGLYSPTIWWLIITPFLFISFGRYRGAMFWMVASCLVVGYFYYVHDIDTAIPPAVAVGDEFYASVMISLFVFLSIFISLVENSRRRAFAQLVTVSEQKSRLMANISHELRTPLNGVLGSVELLDVIVTDPREKELVQTLTRSGHHLIEIINDILDFSKLESGTFDLATTTYDPCELLEDGIDLFRGLAREKRLRLALHVKSDVPPLIRGDQKHVFQVLCNLLSNAIKFTDSGRIDVTLAAATGADGKAARLSIMVNDTGIGIPTDKLKQIYEPFEQIDSSLTRLQGGTGLGLTISRAISELMSATLAAESAPGQGSSFTLEFPIEPVAGSLGDQPQANDPIADAVVLIEPDAETRTILVDMMRALGVALIREYSEFDADALVAIGEADRLLVAAEIVAESPARITSATLPQGDHLIVLGPTHLPLLRSEDFPHGAGILDLPCSRRRLREVLTQASAVMTTESAVGAKSGEGIPHILVVEDNAANRRLAVAMLNELGHAADTAGNGEEAVAATSTKKYDLILMDCRMPLMDGLSATRLIRTQEQSLASPPVRIVAMTGDALDADRDRCLAAGMDDVIKKPFTFEDVAAAVAAVN